MIVKYSNTENGGLSDDNTLKYMAIASDDTTTYTWLLNPYWIKEINKRRYMERVNLITYGLNPVVSRFNNFNDSNNTITNSDEGWALQKIGGSANNTCMCYIFNGDKHFFYVDFYTEKELDVMPLFKITVNDEVHPLTPQKLRGGNGKFYYRTTWTRYINYANAVITIDMTANPNTDKIWITNMGLYNVSRLGMQDMSDSDILAYIDKTKNYIYLDA